MNVALVVGENSDLEAQALRANLEYFGAKVVTYWTGRPLDLIHVLSGKSIYDDMEYIVFCFHGDEGKFIMTELGEDIYEEGEPRGDFGAEEIKRYAKLDGRYVVNSGCTLGEKALAKAFIEKGAQAYIGSSDYVDGNASLLFITRFFYELINHEVNIEEAFQIAQKMDEETGSFELYK
ncbi:hypothetical protein BAMA_21900 [Bacillus manliponensis]|uniref:Delta-aminolevulinic acid dehydratase n=2 Tax=Bacillus manliponensis TaxID=574376 RepID=A0A073JZ00_9BACI|nr:delta-aminolevulinic acid dehydratase [Bacillus manliponensis]KEK19450.1 hypothetical protein BAMA_21900 [Bacillus manliponensis]